MAYLYLSLFVWSVRQALYSLNDTDTGCCDLKKHHPLKSSFYQLASYNIDHRSTCTAVHICDQTCEKGSYTRIQLFDFKDM